VAADAAQFNPRVRSRFPRRVLPPGQW